MQTIIHGDISGLNWTDILQHSKEFDQNPYNSSIFTLISLASICIKDNQICAIHPYSRSILDAVAEKLCHAISEYYQRAVSVAITDDDNIIIRFLPER